MKSLAKVIIAGAIIALSFSGCVIVQDDYPCRVGEIHPQNVEIHRDHPLKKVVYENRCNGTVVKVLKDGKPVCSDRLPVKKFVVYGEGVAPTNTISPAQAKVMAERAAIVDGYRRLAEKLYGIHINSNDTIRDAVAVNSSIYTSINGLIKNAVIKDEFMKDGIYKVRMELNMNYDKWNYIFSY